MLSKMQLLSAISMAGGLGSSIFGSLKPVSGKHQPFENTRGRKHKARNKTTKSKYRFVSRHSNKRGLFEDLHTGARTVLPIKKSGLSVSGMLHFGFISIGVDGEVTNN